MAFDYNTFGKSWGGSWAKTWGYKGPVKAKSRGFVGHLDASGVWWKSVEEEHLARLPKKKRQAVKEILDETPQDVAAALAYEAAGLPSKGRTGWLKEVGEAQGFSPKYDYAGIARHYATIVRIIEEQRDEEDVEFLLLSL